MLKKVVVLGLLLLVGSGCTSKSEDTKEINKSQTSLETKKESKQSTNSKQSEQKKKRVAEFKTENGETFQYTLQKGWNEHKDDNSDLFISSSREGISLLVYSRDDFVDFASFQNSVIQNEEDMNNKIIEQGNKVDLNGKIAYEYVIESTQNGEHFEEFMYLFETEKNYAQIIASTHKSRFADNKEQLKEAASQIEVIN